MNVLKKLASYIKQYKRDSILSPLFVVAETFMEVLIPYLMARMLDNGIQDENMRYVVRMGIILVGAALISLLFGVLSGKYAASASAGFAKNLRQALFYKVQDFSFSNIDKFSTPGLVTRLTTDVANVQNAYMMIIRILVRSPAMLILALIMAFEISHSLSFVFFLAIPILVIGLALIIKHAHPLFERVFKRYDELNNVVQEDLRGIRVVKAYVREDFEDKKFNETSEDIYKDFTKAEKILVLNNPLMQFAIYLCMLLLAWFGSKMIISGTLGTGDLISLLTYTMQILMSLMFLSMVLVMVTMASASANRIYQVLEENSDIVNPQNPIYDISDGSVVFDNVKFSYADDQEKACLTGININIKSGETIGIVGGTGSGKTTLVQLIPRLYDATVGNVTVGGENVKKYDLVKLRDAVAMVLQNNILFSGTIKENLRWGNPNATDEQIEHVCKLALADEFIQKLPGKYDYYIEQGGTNVSGGQRQRLCIARALLKNPKILILDDSTSAVDMKTDALIRKAFKEEIPHITKIIIAQRIASIEEADQIIVMDNGKINGIGTHEELLKTNKIYREVYDSQVRGGDDEVA